VTNEAAGDGKVRLHAELGEADAAKLDLTSRQVQDDLQRVIADAVG
jgi:hypothetical protein